MRLIGNKTKLLGEIEGLLLDQGIEGGTLIDIFAGSCSVAKHFKRRGYRVVANDLLPVCYAQAVASVEVSRPPTYRKFTSGYRAVLDSADGGGPRLPQLLPGRRGRPLLFHRFQRAAN